MSADLANNNLYRLVRTFAVRNPVFAGSIRYFSKPDERFDMTLVSLRVYGNRDEQLTIQAAAGLDSCEDELTERTLVLPTATALAQMKAQAGFPVSNGR